MIVQQNPQNFKTISNLDIDWDSTPELDPGGQPPNSVDSGGTWKQYQTAQIECIKLTEKMRRDAEDDAPNMLAAALWYARRGYALFPLHEPLFDADGHVCGCTCEEYRQSDECRHDHPHLYLGPDKRCDNPGKCPRVGWRDRSTTDTGLITHWWTKWATANIGIDCGKSGIVVLDLDEYKNSYSGTDILTMADQETTTVITGGGGQHLIYVMPEGKNYGNATGKLPDGIDIRGVGGYIVAAPSMHKSGRRYQYEDGYNPVETPPQPLPQALIDILDAAQTDRTAHAVTFSSTNTDKPNLSQWRLSERAIEKITSVAPRGERSEADMTVCVALVYAGATDDDILSVFQHYEIGTHGKYADRGDVYLSHTIGRARAWCEENPRVESKTQLRDEVAAVREWLQSAQLGEWVPLEKQAEIGYRTAGSDRRVADALLDLFDESGRRECYMSLRRLSHESGVGRSTVSRCIDRLDGWFIEKVETDDADPDGAYCYKLSFCVLGTLVKTPLCEECPKYAKTLFSERKSDDPFNIGGGKRDRNRALGVVLGQPALAVFQVLEAHDQPRREAWRDYERALKDYAENPELLTEVAALSLADMRDALIDSPEPVSITQLHHIEGYRAGLDVLGSHDIAYRNGDCVTLSPAYVSLAGQLVSSLGPYALMVISVLDRHGDGQNYTELAVNTGLKYDSISRAVSKLKKREIVSTQRDGLCNRVYLDPDWSDIIDEQRPTMRTNGLKKDRAIKYCDEVMARCDERMDQTSDEAEQKRLKRRWERHFSQKLDIIAQDDPGLVQDVGFVAMMRNPKSIGNIEALGIDFSTREGRLSALKAVESLAILNRPDETPPWFKLSTETASVDRMTQTLEDNYLWHEIQSELGQWREEVRSC